MDKEIAKVRFLLLIGLICFIVGFFICTIRPENVYIGITAQVISMSILIVALFITIRILKLRKNQNEEKNKK